MSAYCLFCKAFTPRGTIRCKRCGAVNVDEGAGLPLTPLNLPSAFRRWPLIATNATTTTGDRRPRYAYIEQPGATEGGEPA